MSQGKIFRSSLYGGGIEEVLPGVHPQALAYDPVDRKLYWTDASAPSIYRANLDGSGLEFFIDTVEESDGLAIDYHNRALYWSTMPFDDRVHRIRLDGTNRETVTSNLGSANNTRDVFLDLTENRVCWLNDHGVSGGDRVDCKNLPPATGFYIIAGSPITPNYPSFALSPTKRIAFVADTGYDRIRDYRTTGNSLGGSFAKAFNVVKMVHDPFDLQVYWTESITGTIRRSSGEYLRPQTMHRGLPAPGCLVVVRPFDCNRNGIDDYCEISCGTANGPCDIPACGTGSDYDRDGLLDECESFMDCDGNGINDRDEINNPAKDCNANQSVDICDIIRGISNDCNHNHRPDECDSLLGYSSDCNTNLAPDDCEIAAGTSIDSNNDSVPDECMFNTPLADPSAISKARFLSFSIPSPVHTKTAIRIRLLSLHHVDPPYTGGTTVPLSIFEGRFGWAGPPVQYVESSSTGTPFYASNFQCTPYYHDWSTIGLLHVTGSAIVPSSIYEVENWAESCKGYEVFNLYEVNCMLVSAPLRVSTSRWGDVEIPFNPPAGSAQPDVADMAALVSKFRSVPGAPVKARALLAGDDLLGNFSSGTLSLDLGFTHIAACVDAFRGKPYPFKMGRCSGPPSPGYSGLCNTQAECGDISHNGNGPCNLDCPP